LEFGLHWLEIDDASFRYTYCKLNYCGNYR
jgi:hypothetical protein